MLNTVLIAAAFLVLLAPSVASARATREDRMIAQAADVLMSNALTLSFTPKYYRLHEDIPITITNCRPRQGYCNYRFKLIDAVTHERLYAEHGIVFPKRDLTIPGRWRAPRSFLPDLRKVR